MQSEGERRGQRAHEGEAEREEERLNLEGDDDPDGKKNIWSEAAAARRETGPVHRRSSGERTRT